MIKYVSAVVPAERVKNLQLTRFKEDFLEKFVDSSGIVERRISKHTVEELMVGAARRLDLDFASLGAVITVTQTPAHQMPGPGFFVCKELGISGVPIFDLNCACDGYVKGIMVAELMAHSTEKPVLLFAGDTLGSFMPKDSPAVSLIFGNAATASLITPGPAYDGEAWSSSIPEGAHHLMSEKGVPYMNGEAVTHFATSEVPKFFKKHGIQGDSYYFHQANKMILGAIEKRLGLDPKRIPHTFEYFGNTSSASIPLTMCMHPPLDDEKRIVLCGFGAGLSISAIVVNKPDFLIFSELQ